MVEQTLTIENTAGLHMRPAGEFAKIATKCASDVKIVHKEKVLNAKSVLNIMAAGIKCGDAITIQCTGGSENEDLQTLVEAVKSGLGE
ncbi:MAG: HPr family phosphocarrier protein [bacterium]